MPRDRTGDLRGGTPAPGRPAVTRHPPVRRRRLTVLAELGSVSAVAGLLLLLLEQRGAPLFVVGAVVFSAGCGWLVSAAVGALPARRRAR